MKHIAVDIDRIILSVEETNMAFEREFESTTTDYTQCRIWIARLEQMISKLQAGSAAIRMSDDDELDVAIAAGDDFEGEGGDINGNLLISMSFDVAATQYAAWIRNLENRERKLRKA